MSKRKANRKRKLPTTPTEPNSKLAPVATTIRLKLMFNAPLRLIVDKTHPDDIYSPHPPTDEQILSVGTIPPSHALVDVKSPDIAAINVTWLNV